MMKKIQWKKLFITCGVCLLPILYGIYLWNDLPGEIAIHFDINNNPDNYSSKGVAVFGLPLMMLLFQIISCIAIDLAENRKKGKNIAKWIIPFVTIVLYAATLGYALGHNTDIRKIACFVVGIIFIALGKSITAFNKDESDNAKKITKIMAIETVILGILMLITIFLPPIATIIWLFLLVPYSVTNIIYGIILRKKQP